MENYEHQQAKQTRTYRNFFEKIHKHFKNLEQKKTKIVVFFSRKFSWIGLHSHRHTDQSSPTLSIGPIRPPRICYPTLMDLGSMSSTSQVDLQIKYSRRFAKDVDSIQSDLIPMVGLRPAKDTGNQQTEAPRSGRFAPLYADKNLTSYTLNVCT